MPAYAESDDLAAFWRPLSAEEDDRATVLLDYAATEIRAEFPDIDSRTPAIDSNLPKLVSLRMVKRAMAGGAGGEGVTQQSTLAGPFQKQQSFANPLGDIYMTDRDKRLLSVNGPARRAYTINTIVGLNGD